MNGAEVLSKEIHDLCDGKRVVPGGVEAARQLQTAGAMAESLANRVFVTP